MNDTSLVKPTHVDTHAEVGGPTAKVKGLLNGNAREHDSFAVTSDRERTIGKDAIKGLNRTWDKVRSREDEESGRTKRVLKGDLMDLAILPA